MKSLLRRLMEQAGSEGGEDWMQWCLSLPSGPQASISVYPAAPAVKPEKESVLSVSLFHPPGLLFPPPGHAALSVQGPNPPLPVSAVTQEAVRSQHPSPRIEVGACARESEPSNRHSAKRPCRFESWSPPNNLFAKFSVSLVLAFLDFLLSCNYSYSHI